MKLQGQRQSANVEDARRARVQGPTPGQRYYRAAFPDAQAYPDGQDTKRMAIRNAIDADKARKLKNNPMAKALKAMDRGSGRVAPKF